MAISREEIKAALGQMPVLDLVGLIQELEDEWGVSAAAPSVVMSNAASGAADADAVEQTEFTATMTSFGDNKVAVIKVVRSITSMGLKEAKELVEAAPSKIKENVGKEEAEEVKKQLEEAGATVEIK